MPDIPLSVGSKLELSEFLSLPNFRILPRTLTICPHMHSAVYMTEAPRVLHFSAFIIKSDGPSIELLLDA